MNRQIVYIAGPMTGLPEGNYPAFNAAAEAWRKAGYKVLNPAENDNGSGTQHWSQFMRLAIAMVIQSNAIALLPGWERSKGARLEVEIAKALDFTFYDATVLPPQRIEIDSSSFKLQGIHG